MSDGLSETQLEESSYVNELGIWRNGSVLIERYKPDRGKPQWILYVVRRGELQMVKVCDTRHEALTHADGLHG